MNEIINEYLDWKGTYAHRASVNYRIWMNRFVEVCGNKRLENYGIPDIIKYRNWLETRYGSYTVQFATIVLKNFLQYCKTQNMTCLSPKLVKLPRFTAKSHRAITEDEFQKIISVIPTNEFPLLRDTLLIRMLWDTGVRVSELGDLDLSQINESQRSAVIQTKKTGQKRIIVWSEESHQLLTRYLPVRLELQKCNNATALFVGYKNGTGWSSRLTSRSIQRIVKHFVDQAGLKEKITPHSFRHGWAHKRRDNNAPLAFIQKGLGHINPASTFVYEQYNDKEFEQNANKYLRTSVVTN